MAGKDSVIIHIDGDDSGFKKSLSGIGNVAKKSFSAVTKGIAAAAAGLTALTVAAVKSYGEYEQLIGGVDTLFESSSKKVQENAAKAYRTAGLSANEYMETATSFAASLKQSFDDTAEGVSAAADAADMAVIDMADNANKMGTAMESIQVAYQGFAKQNYTMLDNLKLGYGGTKEEMERLLADAQKLSGIKYDISNLADVYNAIHVIQTELGITGTTAKEAETTIVGSAKMMKAAWSNMMVGFADENANFDALIDELANSVIVFADNLIPVVEAALGGLGDFASKASETLIPKLVEAITNAAPELADAAIDLVEGLVVALVESADDIGAAGGEISGNLINKVVEGIFKGTPLILDAAAKLLSAFAEALGDAVPLLKPVTKLVEFLGDSIDGLIPPVDKAAVALDNLNASHEEAMQKAEKAGDSYLEEAERISTLKDSLYQMEEQLKNGTLSQEEADGVQKEFKKTASELEALIPGITSLLYDETGAIDIQKGSVDALAASYIELATAKAIAEQYAAKIAATSTALEEAKEIKKTAASNYQAQKKKEDAIGYAADSYGFRSKEEADAFNTMTDANTNVGLLESKIKGLKEEATNAQKEVSKLFEKTSGTAEETGGKVTGAANTAAGSTKKAAKEVTDTLTKEGQKQLQNIKDSYATGEISTKEYFAELQNLRDENLKKNSEGWKEITAIIDDECRKQFQSVMDAYDNGEISSRQYYLKLRELRDRNFIEESEYWESITKIIEAARDKDLKNIQYAHDIGETSDEEYYKALAEHRDAFFDKGSDGWRQYTLDIYNWQKSVLDKVQQDANAAVEEFKKTKEEVASGLSDDIADTYQTVTVQDGENEYSYTKLADIGAENAKLDNYNEKLDELFERNGGELPDYVMQQLKSMNVDEGLNYMEAMLRASDGEFEAYINGLNVKAEKQGLIADKLLTEDAKRLTENLTEIYGTIPEGFFDIGEDSATEFAEGFGAQLATELKNIMDGAMASFYSTFTPAIMTAMPGAGSVSNSYYNNYYMQPSGEGNYAQIKALDDRETYNRMTNRQG